ncbi:hypothetical protein KFE19_02900 [Dysosmobacter sp. Marseille-Q4140]|nr:hypothetical protein KFE19_02900 [Dysosmobacter sp. Marseille-Q4140]
MDEILVYTLIAILPSFLLALASEWLPGRLGWLHWLILLWPAALLVLAALAVRTDPGLFIGWNVFVAGWLVILAGLALAGFGLGTLLGKLIRKRRM